MDIYAFLYIKWITNTAQGTLLNDMQQPGWDGGLGENGNRCMYG